MHLNIALLSGDGIGPEVLAQTVKCLKAVEYTFDHKFTFKKALFGAVAIKKYGTPLPDATLQICKNANAILCGTIGSPKYDNNPNADIRPEQGLFQLRKELDLFACVRPVKVYPSLIENRTLNDKSIAGTDLVIYRDLTGGIHFGEKNLSGDDTIATDKFTYTEKEISRLAHLAFKAANKRKRKVTLVDKANVLETSRLWRSVVTEISKSYPQVELNCMYVDNAVVQMMLNPKQFDVILTDNMFGDILSDQGSVIIGSVGLLPSASIGLKNAMFEPFHGSYPQAKGKNIANPVASILSAAMLLLHFNLRDEANAVVAAVRKSIEKKVVTPDVLGSSKYGTDYVGTYIADNIEDSEDNSILNDENIGLGKSTII